MDLKVRQIAIPVARSMADDAPVRANLVVPMVHSGFRSEVPFRSDAVEPSRILITLPLEEPQEQLPSFVTGSYREARGASLNGLGGARDAGARPRNLTRVAVVHEYWRLTSQHIVRVEILDG